MGLEKAVGSVKIVYATEAARYACLWLGVVRRK